MNSIMIYIVLVIFGFGILCQTGGSPTSSGTSAEGWTNLQNRINAREKRRHPSECEHSILSRELCQRCAKVTKSRLAYGMCCERRENTREWCVKFLNFGLSAANFGTVSHNYT